MKIILRAIAHFFSKKRNIYLCLLIALGIAAMAHYQAMGLARRTFVFYMARTGETIVEDRMLRHSSSLETDMRRYIEEALLGPESQRAELLFSRDTRLYSLILREGVVYANFSENSALPLDFNSPNGVFLSFLTLNEGLRRNFSAVQNVKFFIGGNQIFFNEFREIFALSADNSIKTGQKELTN